MRHRNSPNGCWAKDPAPESGKRYSGPTSLAGDGYDVSDRRARGTKPGTIVSKDRAERRESFYQEYDAPGSESEMGFYSDYDD